MTHRSGSLNTLSVMANTPITLAALATSAVPGLQVTGYRVLRLDDAVEHSVILESSEGELLVQLPTSSAAEVHHSAKILGQSALTAGVREQLPFDAPRVLGITRKDDTRAIVSSYLSGDHFNVEDLTEDALLLGSIAESLAAIHSLPLSVVTQQGLRARTPSDARLDAHELVQRSYQTGLVPETVSRHWTAILSDAPLWDFQPLVIHGTLSDDTLLLSEDTVTGILDWSGLSIGDPAVDFGWLWAAGEDVLTTALEVYAASLPANAVSGIIERSRFWHELEIAQWLLHGIEHKDDEIVSDAIELFDQLVSHLTVVPVEAPRDTGLSAAESAKRPASIPQDFSETASFDMLDEDRDFSEPREFLTEPVEPLTEEVEPGSPHDGPHQPIT